jgi:hypothetical protein
MRDKREERQLYVGGGGDGQKRVVGLLCFDRGSVEWSVL